MKHSNKRYENSYPPGFESIDHYVPVRKSRNGWFASLYEAVFGRSKSGE